MKYTYQKDGYKPKDEIFVFGSNLAGVHGGGAAKEAYKNYGARWGETGYMGHSYGISTKDHQIITLPLLEIAKNVGRFLRCAELNPQTKFYVSRVGCVLAGYKDEDIAPMFKDAPTNCSFAENWKPYLECD